MFLLDRCTQQALLAVHPVEEIESLECMGMDSMTWMRKAAQDPTMSTYMRKSKAMTDYTTAKQFLSRSLGRESETVSDCNRRDWWS